MGQTGPYKSSLQQFLKRNRFIALGLPFMVMLVGGSFGLKQFTALRYQYRKKESFDKDEAKRRGLPIKEEETSIHKEYEKLQASDIDTWENIRGPRPWEDSKTIQDQQRAQNKTPLS